MKAMLLGAIAMASFVAGLFFLSFWRSTKDRFFFLFAIAFWIEAANRVILSFVTWPETRPEFYLIRLTAFGLILFAIMDKNQSRP